MISLEKLKKNAGGASLFSQIRIIEFYDGPTEAVCQLADVEEWVICSMVYFNIQKNERIFSMLPISFEWSLKLELDLEVPLEEKWERHEKVKKEIGSFYSGYSGDVFLFRGCSLNKAAYQLAQIPLKYLKYFKGIDDVLGQSEGSMAQWTGLFPS